MSYEPKTGDRVALVRRIEGVVTKATDKYTWINSDMMGYMRPDWDVELVEAAPVPFEVGKPLTAEMGEPPVGSVILENHRSLRDVWHRRGDGKWYSASPSRTGGMSWNPGFTPAFNILLHLGESK